MLVQALGGSAQPLELLENLGLAFPCEFDPDLIVPYVHLFPLDVQVANNIGAPTVRRLRVEPMILATDMHPQILSRTTVGTKEEGAVMYIGPDSLALVQHLRTPLRGLFKGGRFRCANDSGGVHQEEVGDRTLHILDLCTGSGVQALSTLVALSKVAPKSTATCVDVNDRALRFVKFNMLLNGLEGKVRTAKCDLLAEGGLSLQKVLGSEPSITGGEKDNGNRRFDVVLANPPFIPVPPCRNIISTVEGNNDEDPLLPPRAIQKRYGLFSSGGSNGEDVLESIMRHSPSMLREHSGLLGIVSEFMNPPLASSFCFDTVKAQEPREDDVAGLCDRIGRWWTDNLRDEKLPVFAEGILFTNEQPVLAGLYASRRSQGDAERQVWMDHLNDQGIERVSPGLLFVVTGGGAPSQAMEGRGRLQLGHSIVPKSDFGSIWTPHNHHAVAYTGKVWSGYFL